ncbi:hypothetical protein J5N97_008370 [Dioscorea zingiberensis]|uniref:Viral late gene transcription factor 3 zinc ribbon domain-containing protein n=1 Tax=Dioscorea zingiberensis TaxID=325984 RepID=A0A9D5HKM4_9LILI|nr:hypothetical protein J5N97_008370 [Dioscorea zingiberensis]
MVSCSVIPLSLSARPSKWQMRANPYSPEFPHWKGRRSWYSHSDGAGHARASTIIRVVDGGADLIAPTEITWQIAVGALAGVTPFIVAGIEFSKRIVAQRKCGVCGGSGLVQRDDYYVRCPGCGGFLPWQSWKRFFTG